MEMGIDQVVQKKEETKSQPTRKKELDPEITRKLREFNRNWEDYEKDPAKIKEYNELLRKKKEFMRTGGLVTKEEPKSREAPKKSLVPATQRPSMPAPTE